MRTAQRSATWVWHHWWPQCWIAPTVIVRRFVAPNAAETLKPSKPIVQKAPKPEVATFEGWVGETDRRRGQTRGRPIGEERRQSIRLARVLAYKDWDAQRLATRLKMPIEMIENAIEGREDLASLKVEALLSTWEEEMQHVGWKPDG